MTFFSAEAGVIKSCLPNQGVRNVHERRSNAVNCILQATIALIIPDLQFLLQTYFLHDSKSHFLRMGAEPTPRMCQLSGTYIREQKAMTILSCPVPCVGGGNSGVSWVTQETLRGGKLVLSVLVKFTSSPFSWEGGFFFALFTHLHGDEAFQSPCVS